MTLTERAELGIFAPDRGRLNRAVAVGMAAAGTSAALALLRVVTDVVDPGVGARWATGPAVALGIVAFGAGMVGGYRATVRGESGREVARLLVWAGAVLALVAFLYGSLRDGAIRLDQFGRAYFDTEILSAIWPSLLRGLVNTLKAVFLAELLSILVGLVFATLQLSRKRWLRRLAVAYVDLIRGLPLLVLTSLIYFGTTYIGITLSPFAAVVTSLAVNASAYVAEIFRAGIQAIPPGQRDAARSVGMPPEMVMLFVLIPQAVRAVIPPLVSEFIALTKDSAQVFLVIGATVGSSDLFTAARTASASTFSPTPYIGAAIGYMLVTIPLARIVGVLERRLRAGLA